MEDIKVLSCLVVLIGFFIIWILVRIDTTLREEHRRERDKINRDKFI